MIKIKEYIEDGFYMSFCTDAMYQQSANTKKILDCLPIKWSNITLLFLFLIY